MGGVQVCHPATTRRGLFLQTTPTQILGGSWIQQPAGLAVFLAKICLQVPAGKSNVGQLWGQKFGTGYGEEGRVLLYEKVQFPAAALCVFMSVISACCCMAVGQLALGYQWGFSVGAA